MSRIRQHNWLRLRQYHKRGSVYYLRWNSMLNQVEIRDVKMCRLDLNDKNLHQLYDTKH